MKRPFNRGRRTGYTTLPTLDKALGYTAGGSVAFEADPHLAAIILHPTEPDLRPLCREIMILLNLCSGRSKVLSQIDVPVAAAAKFMI